MVLKPETEVIFPEDSEQYPAKIEFPESAIGRVVTVGTFYVTPDLTESLRGTQQEFVGTLEAFINSEHGFEFCIGGRWFRFNFAGNRRFYIRASRPRLKHQIVPRS